MLLAEFCILVALTAFHVLNLGAFWELELYRLSHICGTKMLWLFFLFFDEIVILYLCSSYLAGFCTSAALTGFHVFALKLVHVSSRLKVRLHQSAVHSVWTCPRSPFKEHYASVIIMSSSWTAHYSVYEDNRNSSSCIWTWRKELLCEPGFICLAWISVIRPI